MSSTSPSSASKLCAKYKVLYCRFLNILFPNISTKASLKCAIQAERVFTTFFFLGQTFLHLPRSGLEKILTCRITTYSQLARHLKKQLVRSVDFLLGRDGREGTRGERKRMSAEHSRKSEATDGTRLVRAQSPCLFVCLIDSWTYCSRYSRSRILSRRVPRPSPPGRFGRE